MMTNSPSSTLNRRIESPVGPRNFSSPATPSTNRAPMDAGRAQTQARMNVAATDDVVTTSSKPKKVLNNTVSNPLTEDGEEAKRRGILKSMATFSRMMREKDDPSVAPVCEHCKVDITRGPFITAMGRTWCPAHFLCSMENCRKSLQETGFVEEKGLLYCEDCYSEYLAPDCKKCRKKIIGNCLKAIGTTFHPECFNCAYCGKLFSNSPFYLEDGLPYCEEDWNELFTTKCVSCGFPIEAGDRWVEALNSNYHSNCFNCSLCKKNLEGQSFFVKGGKPFCKGHAQNRM